MKRNKVLASVGVIMGTLIILYFSGPKPTTPLLDTKLPDISVAPNILEQDISRRETAIKIIKPNNESRIVWHDSTHKTKTPYCIVYLHGFSASPQEGYPVHCYIAHKFGCNLYLPRLYEHGLNEKEPLLNLTEENYINSAKEAVAEAKNLGEKVIIMGTSTGASFALYIAAGNPEIAGLILYSPNIDLYDSKSFVLTQPWGLQIARMIVGGNYYSFSGPAGMQKYWTSKYRVEALIRMKNLIQYTMKKEIFQKVKQPVLVCYYYKNEKQQDDVVSIPAMFKMFDELGTNGALKRKIDIPEAAAHALPSAIWSHDIPKIEKETAAFMEEIMHIKALE